MEKLITKGKSGSLNDRRIVIARLGKNCFEVNKLFGEIAKRYENRNGGYLRIMKAGFRTGDKAPMAVIEFVDRNIEAKGVQKSSQISN